LENSYINIGDERLRVIVGLMSGLKLTSIIGGLCNKMYKDIICDKNIEVKRMTNNAQFSVKEEEIFQGDDAHLKRLSISECLEILQNYELE